MTCESAPRGALGVRFVMSPRCHPQRVKNGPFWGLTIQSTRALSVPNIAHRRPLRCRLHGREERDMARGQGCTARSPGPDSYHPAATLPPLLKGDEDEAITIHNPGA